MYYAYEKQGEDKSSIPILKDSDVVIIEAHSLEEANQKMTSHGADHFT